MLALIAIMFISIIRNWMPTEFAMLISMNMMVAAQIIPVDVGYAGFSNSGVLTVTVLFVVAEGLSATGALDYFMGKVMGNPKTLGSALVRMMLPSAILSAFINNTPQVALMIPILRVWARKVNIPPSLLMMPMSFATILGGTLSLLGTSTNLVVSGKYQVTYCKAIGLFDIGLAGFPVMFVGLAYILIFAPYLLPGQVEYDRRFQAGRLLSKTPSMSFAQWFRLRVYPRNKSSSDDDVVEAYHETPEGFVMHASVSPGSFLVGKTVTNAGLRGTDFFLFSVERNNVVSWLIGPDYTLQTNDILGFSGGIPSEFIAFAKNKNLTPIAVAINDEEFGFQDDHHWTTQAVIRADSVLVGTCAKDVSFRTTYGAAIMGISRAGEPLKNARLGQVVFKVGDVLLLAVTDAFDWNAMAVQRDLKSRASIEPGLELRVEREFVVPMVVAKTSPLRIIPGVNNRTLKRSGLLNVSGVTLLQIQRGGDGQHFDVQDTDFVVKEGDVLWFVGDRDCITGLRRVPGLVDSVDPHLKRTQVPLHYRRLVEVVISHRSEFVGHTVRETRFRSRYSAVIVSVLRMDFSRLQKIGDYVIKGGDVLIVDAGPDFYKFFRDDPNFAMLSEIEYSTPPRWDKFYIAAVTTTAMITLEVIFSVNMLVLGVLNAAVMLLLRVLTPKRAHASVDWAVIITVASAFGLSSALERSNVAGIVGKAFVDAAVATKTGLPGLLATILFVTMLFSSLIANNAAALLMYPIAAQAAALLKVDPLPIMFALMLGASDYATPFGYQTNQMVVGPGRYVATDFLKFGGPLMLVLLVWETIVLSTLDKWYITWLVSLGVFVACVLFDFTVRGKRPLKDMFYSPNLKDVRSWGRSTKSTAPEPVVKV